MKRREFLKGAAALPLAAQTIFGAARRRRRAEKIVKPARLRAGDAVAVVAPSSGVSAEDFEKALQNLRDLGFQPKPGKNARARRGFLAGTDKQRIEDLHEAFADRRVKAVWCVRGGYGATRFLPDLDFKIIRRNPKILVGYSDITALHLAIYQNTGLVTFHGPVAASTFSDYAKNHLLGVLMNPSAPYKIGVAPDNAAKESALFKTETVRAGKARGALVGGNLSLLAAMAGTAFGLRNSKDKILFLEDVNEQPYRVDRMLTQLRQSADLRGLAGVALGVFEGCDPRDASASQSLIEVVRERLGDLGVPVIYGLSFGHIRDQCTLPVGVAAELDAEKATLTLLESGVV